MSARAAGWRHRALLTAAMFALSNCTAKPDESAIRVDVIGTHEQIANPLRESSTRAAQMMLGSTAQGLLTYNSKGDVIGALAESWIVEDGGASYIFRLKPLNWPDGKPVRAEQVAKLLKERLLSDPLTLAGLKPEVLAMTDRVIEIRLESNVPGFLQILAQPRFAVLSPAGGTGPYRATATASGIALTLIPQTLSVDPAAEEEPGPEIERRLLNANRAALALARFRTGQTDLVVGGTFHHLPFIPATGLALTDLRKDPVEGLFGLAFAGSSKFLAEVSVRDALSRAIDRAELANSLPMPGWRTAIYPLPAPYELTRLPSLPAWTAQPIADRIASARGVVARWIAANGPPPVLRVALPSGIGGSTLFHRIAQDFGRLDVRVTRVASDAPADLRLIDEVAPFDSAFWYLSRLDCAAGLQCDPSVARLLAEALSQRNEAEQARLLGEAEHATVAFVGFIPFGQPIRWSLANKRLTGFQPSQRGFHPLNVLVIPPN